MFKLLKNMGLLVGTNTDYLRVMSKKTEESPMLSAQDRAIVKSTVPLLESGGEALITHFYRMMLS